MVDVAISQYLGTFSITIIKSKYHFLLALSLGVTIIMSSIIVAGNNATAQTLETITEERKAFENNPQIKVGSEPRSIAVNEITNKIYVANARSGTVSIIDSTSGSAAKNIRVGASPSFIAVDNAHNKIYVANTDSNTVSVIDGNNDSKIREIRVGNSPQHIAITYSGKLIYVANTGDNTVSVIDTSNDTREPHDIAVGTSPLYMAEDLHNKIYVANFGNNTVSVINENTARVIKNITVGEGPTYIAFNLQNKIYVANSRNNTVSVIDAKTTRVIKNITVGVGPTYIAFNHFPNEIVYVLNPASNSISVINGANDSETGVISPLRGPLFIASAAGKIWASNTFDNTVSVIDGSNGKKEPHDIPVGKRPTIIAPPMIRRPIIYVLNQKSNTVSAIDGYSDKVAAGVTLNTHPANSGTIMCDKKEYPTNTYLYVDNGTKCTAQSKDFQFSGWVENFRNSTIPISDTSGNLTVNRYGSFTANFKPLPPAIPPEFLYLLVGIILSSLFGWSIPSIAGWYKARKQLEHLEECINLIGKLDKNAIENKIKGYYVHGKISEDHRQFLKDKISEYYEKEFRYKDGIDF